VNSWRTSLHWDEAIRWAFVVAVVSGAVKIHGLCTLDRWHLAEREDAGGRGWQSYSREG